MTVYFSLSIVRVSGRLISSLVVGVCGVVDVGMFVSVSVVSIVSIAPPGWVAAVGRATHPQPTLGSMGPMGPMDPIFIDIHGLLWTYITKR